MGLMGLQEYSHGKSNLKNHNYNVIIFKNRLCNAINIIGKLSTEVKYQ
jgi:hypothetical protein